MQRRQFGREFKIEAVRLIKDRGVSVAQASRDLDVHENQLRKWVKLFSADPAQAFPGHGQMKPEQLEIEKLRREVAKLKAERDILKKAAAYFAKAERIRGKVYRTRDDARADVFDYIERFYNAVRRHSTIGYISPVEFEKKAGLA